MAERLNLIGRTFGRLTVLELSSVPGGNKLIGNVFAYAVMKKSSEVPI